MADPNEMILFLPEYVPEERYEHIVPERDCEYIGGSEFQVCTPPIEVERGPEETVTEEIRRAEAKWDARGVVGVLLIGVTAALMVKGSLR